MDIYVEEPDKERLYKFSRMTIALIGLSFLTLTLSIIAFSQSTNGRGQLVACQQALQIDDKIIEANASATSIEATNQAADTIRQLTPERVDKYDKCFNK